MFAIRAEHHVKPGRMEEWLELARTNARASLEEPRCHRFDVLVSREAPEHGLLYELYEDREAWLAHCETPHFKSFVEKVQALVERRERGEFDLRA